MELLSSEMTHSNTTTAARVCLSCFKNQLRCGTALVEVTVATAIVAMLLVTSINSVVFVLGNRKAGSERQVANLIFSELSREANARAFHDDEPSAGLGRDDESSSNRIKLDDFDDFGDLRLSVILDENDDKVELFEGWQMKSSASYIDSRGDTQLNSGELKRVDIALVAPSGKVFEYFLLRHADGYMLDHSSVPEPLYGTVLEARSGDAVVRANTVRVSAEGAE